MSTMTGSMFGAPTGKAKIPSGYKQGNLPQFNPAQMQLFQQLFSHVGPESYLSKLAGGDQSTFAQTEAPALRQFNELQGNIASRFSGMGSGARRSSGFQNTLNQASSNFAQDLQGQRQGLQRQALMDLMKISGSLLNERPYQNFLIKKEHQPSFIQKLIGTAAPVAGAVAGGAFGGIPGAMLGSSIGSQFGSAFL